MSDVTFKAFAGLRNKIRAERFEPGDLVSAMNVNIGNDGQLARRDGRELKLAASAHSLWSDGIICLFVDGTTLKRLNADYTATTVVELTSGDPMSYVPVNGRVYYGNGTDKGIIGEAGAARTWGLVPPGLPLAANAGGALPAGTYQFAMTYVREDGQESGTGLAGRIDVTTGGIEFSRIPVSDDPTVTHKIIYITPQNGDVLYRAAVLREDVVEYTYTGGPLSVPLNTQYMQDPPAGEIVAYHFGHLYVVRGSIVYYSQPYGYELFDLRDFFQFDSPVRVFAPVDSGIWVGTDNGVAWLAGVEPGKLEKVDRSSAKSVKGTLAYIHADSLPAIKEGVPDTKVALWWTDDGVVAGYPSGVLHTLTDSRYRPSIDGKTGAGLVAKTTSGDQYIAVIKQ